VTSAAFLRRVAVTDGVLSALAVALWAVLGSPDGLLGVAAGVVLGTANLVALAWLARAAFTAPRHRWVHLVLLGLKFAVLIGAVWIAVRYLPMDLAAFVAGLSAPLVAMVGTAVWAALRQVELEP
jgi:hypothetical protein